MKSTIINLQDCEHLAVYETAASYLTLAVFNKDNNSFTGIRHKPFSYLYTEYHWDIGEPCGTVCPLRKIDTLPTDTNIEPYLSTIDYHSARLLNRKDNQWVYTDTNEPYDGINQITIPNQELYNLLSKYDLKAQG